MANDREKEAAARASLRFVREGDIVGLGTGSTAAFAVRFLGERVQAGLKIRGIPTSIHTQELAASLGIPLTTLDEFQEIDITIDGADEVDAELRLIKGGGGALLREKIVASATREFVIIADYSKQTDSRSSGAGAPTGEYARRSGAWIVYRDGGHGVDRQGRSGNRTTTRKTLSQRSTPRENKALGYLARSRSARSRRATSSAVL